MKKFISIASSYLGHVGFYFLAVIVVFASIAAVAASTTFNIVLVWTALLFAALLGIADGVFALKFLGSYLVKATLHAVLAIVAFAISFVGGSGVIEGGKTAVMGVLLFSALMVLITVIRCVLYYATAKKENENKSYQYLYTAKD